MIVTDIRKVVAKSTIRPGVYSGTITGYIVTFTFDKEEYECHVMSSVKGVKVPCHVLVDNHHNFIIIF